jgi:hypothetical protein
MKPYDDEAQIVPFGKYHDQPIESLLADRGYVEWLMNQPGLVAMLQAKYPAIYNIITIGAPASDDTPEHNKLQTMFLDCDFQYAFLEAALGRSVEQISAELAAKLNRETQAAFSALEQRAKAAGLRSVETLENRRKSLAKVIAERDAKNPADEEWFKSWDDDRKFWIRQVRCSEDRLKEIIDFVSQLRAPQEVKPSPPQIKVEFECGYDVYLEFVWRNESEPLWQLLHGWEFKIDGKTTISGKVSHSFKIELKPLMGDDFPSVLRQMKRNDADTLVNGEFESKSCTLSQVRGMFGAEKQIITLAEIQAIQARGGWPDDNDATADRTRS